MKKFLVLCLLGLPLAAQILPDYYVVELEAEPALAAAPRARDRAAITAGRTRARRAQANIRPQVEREGAEIVDSVEVVANALIVHAKPDRAERLKKLAGVRRVRPVTLYHKTLDRAIELSHVTEAWSIVGAPETAGAGVKIAIIDTGIDARHPGFTDTGFTMPDGFPKVNKESDRAQTNNKIIVCRSYDAVDGKPSTALDRDGHGTGVAMAAGGVLVATSLATIRGVAPGAYLGSYKVFPDGGDGAPDALILHALDDAVSDGMDVVNLSLGSFPANRPEEDPLAEAIERVASKGIIVVVAAGNDGPDPNTIGSPATARSAIAVGMSRSDRVYAPTVRLGDGTGFKMLPGDGPNTRTLTAPLADVAQFDATGLGCSSLPPGSLTGKIALILRGDCFFEQKLNLAAEAGARAAIVYSDSARPEAISMSVGTARLPAAMVSYEDGLALKQRAQTAPDSEITMNFQLSPLAVSSAQVASSSSRGPSVDLALKPEIVATGDPVLTAAPNNQFALVSGTSIATPIVTGAAAVLKAARPGLTVAQYRSLLVHTASTLAGAESALPVEQAGGGLLNLAAALRSTVTAAPMSVSFGSGGGTIQRSSTMTIYNTSPADDTFAISVEPMGAGPAPVPAVNTLALPAGQSQDVDLQFTAEGLTAGEYQGFVRVSSTQGAEIRIPYWHGVTGVPKYLRVFETPKSGWAGSTEEFLVRVTDQVGIPLDVSLEVVPVSGGGSLRRIEPAGAGYTGYYNVQVRLGTVPGSNVFRIAAGDVSTEVTIEGTP